MTIKYKVNLSIAANNDLDEIFSYITNTLLAAETDRNLMNEIQKMVLSLDGMPQRFSYSLDPTLAQRGYRRVLVKKYIVLFLVDEENKIVNVARVFHGSMDYQKYI